LSGIHSVRARLIACCVASIAVLGALVFAPAAGASNVGSSYLALGDSLAYGYHAAQFASEYPSVHASNYEEGYVNFFYNSLKPANPSVTLTNDGCPGETTETLIEGSGIPGYCAGGPTGTPFPQAFLHHPYTGVSQLADAEAFLKANPNTSPITVDIGANDLLQFLEHTCGFPATYTCTESQVKAEDETVAGNIGYIIGKLHHVAPHAQIIYLAFYNAYPLVLPAPGGDADLAALNSLVANDLAVSEPGTLFVNPEPLVNPMTGGTEAGDLTTLCKYTGMCPGGTYNPASPEADIHPSKEGYAKIGQLISAAFMLLHPTGGGGGGGGTNSNCNGAVGGSLGEVTVGYGAVCMLMAGTKVSGNVQVQQGGTLIDEGAMISGNLQVNGAIKITVKGGSIGGNLQVQDLTGGPNALCGAIVHGNVQVQNNGASSTIDIGNLGACAGGAGLTVGGNLEVQHNKAKVTVAGNQVGGNLQVKSNEAGVTISNNTAQHNIQVQSNAGGTLTSNSAGADCQLQSDNPLITGTLNSAGAGHSNSCNRNA